ncbi:ThuA domain-containing protein, partial [Radiobacillus sp. PE A8.2]|uniref:ThuA domain-containing protein n=1 Tax=Radiobacillus sp. PE A8.2 TaxID=3380349 RepID=UPI00388E3EC5
MTTKITAVLGDYYHQKKLAVASLKASVASLDDVEVSYVAVEELVEHLESNPNIVILFAENRINPEETDVRRWMDKSAAQAITDYVNNGGAWLGWHSGMASYETIEPYIDMLRGCFTYHPKEHQLVTYESSGLEIGNNIRYQILDEHYFVQSDEHNTNVFLKSESIDGISIAGWYHQYGKGRVACFTPAHREEGLMHPITVQLLTNCIR